MSTNCGGRRGGGAHPGRDRRRGRGRGSRAIDGDGSIGSSASPTCWRCCSRPRPLTPRRDRRRARRPVPGQDEATAGGVRARQGGAARASACRSRRRSCAAAGRRADPLLDRPRAVRARRPRPRAGRDAGAADRRRRGPLGVRGRRGRAGDLEARRRSVDAERPPSSAHRAGAAALPALRDAAAPRSTVDVRLSRRRPATSIRAGVLLATGSGTSSAANTTARRAAHVPRRPHRGRRRGVTVGPTDASSARRRSIPRPAFPADPKRVGAGSDAVASMPTVLIDALRAAGGRARGRHGARGARHADGVGRVVVPCGQRRCVQDMGARHARPRRGARPARRAGRVDRVADRDRRGRRARWAGRRSWTAAECRGAARAGSW